jgi:hypothetical protein
VAIAHVQSRSSYPGGSGPSNLAFSSDVTAGNLVVVSASTSVEAATFTVTDTRATHLTWNALTRRTSAGGTVCAAQIFWALDSVGGGLTVRVSTTGSDLGFSIHEYSGIDTSATYDTEAFGTSATATVATSSFQPANASSLIFAHYANEVDVASVNSSAWNSLSFTARTEEASHIHLTRDLVISSTANSAATFTMSAARNSALLVIAVFKGASGGGATPINATPSDEVSVTDALGGQRNFRAAFGDNLEN